MRKISGSEYSFSFQGEYTDFNISSTISASETRALGRRLSASYAAVLPALRGGRRRTATYHSR